jgi:hypothetical protein
MTAIEGLPEVLLQFPASNKSSQTAADSITPLQRVGRNIWRYAIRDCIFLQNTTTTPDLA